MLYIYHYIFIFHTLSLSYTIIYYHILSYTIICYHILSYTSIYYHILSYTSIYYHILYILTNRAAVGKSYPAALWSEPYVARPFGHGVRRRDVGGTDHCGCSDGGLCFGEGEHGSSWGYQQKYRCHGHEDGCNQQGRGVFIATHGSRFGPWSSVSKCCVDEELCHLWTVPTVSCGWSVEDVEAQTHLPLYHSTSDFWDYMDSTWYPLVN